MTTRRKTLEQGEFPNLRTLSLRYLRTPFLRAHIANMLRKKPAMPFEVFDPILFFAIHDFVELFDDLRTGGLGLPMVRIHILDEHGNRCSLFCAWFGSGVARARASHHDVGVAKVHLRTARLTIPVVLTKSERLAQPLYGRRKIPINNVGN